MKLLWQSELNKAKQRIVRNNDFMFGVVDVIDTEKVPFIYEWIWALDNNGLYKVEKQGKIGYIDTLGCTIVPFLYNNIDEFGQNGLARATRDNGYVYIDKKGCEYDYYCY